MAFRSLAPEVTQIVGSKHSKKRTRVLLSKKEPKPTGVHEVQRRKQVAKKSKVVEIDVALLKRLITVAQESNDYQWVTADVHKFLINYPVDFKELLRAPWHDPKDPHPNAGPQVTPT